MNGWMDGEQIVRWMDGWMDGRMDRWTDTRTDGRMDTTSPRPEFQRLSTFLVYNGWVRMVLLFNIHIN